MSRRVEIVKTGENEKGQNEYAFVRSKKKPNQEKENRKFAEGLKRLEPDLSNRALRKYGASEQQEEQSVAESRLLNPTKLADNIRTFEKMGQTPQKAPSTHQGESSGKNTELPLRSKGSKANSEWGGTTVFSEKSAKTEASRKSGKTEASGKSGKTEASRKSGTTEASGKSGKTEASRKSGTTEASRKSGTTEAPKRSSKSRAPESVASSLRSRSTYESSQYDEESSSGSDTEVPERSSRGSSHKNSHSVKKHSKARSPDRASQESRKTSTRMIKKAPTDDGQLFWD
ncbi:hypothetical protein EAE96_002502 [Botrytis aclada]|nr:hypothetical protein EAE96_002502 [Botrytis aclada]